MGKLPLERELSDAEIEGGRTAARHRLRTPSYYLWLLFIAAVIGVGFELLGAALGDGQFDVERAIQNMVPALAAPLVMTVITARSER